MYKKIHFAVVGVSGILGYQAFHLAFDKRLSFRSLLSDFSSYREQIVFCILDTFKAHQFESGGSYSLFLVDDDDPDNANKWIYLTYLNAYRLQRLKETAKEIDKILGLFEVTATLGVDFGCK